MRFHQDFYCSMVNTLLILNIDESLFQKKKKSGAKLQAPARASS